MDMENCLMWENIDLDTLVDDLGSDFSDEHEQTALDRSASNASHLVDLLDGSAVAEHEAKMVMYDCPVCGKTFKTAGGFRGHMAKQHQEVDRSSFKGIYPTGTHTWWHIKCPSRNLYSTGALSGLAHRRLTYKPYY